MSGDPGRAGWTEATIRDVAGLAGVSTSTVSRVLNERDGVAPQTRERVRAAIRRLDFTPSIAAQRLRSSAGPSAVPSAVPVIGVVAARVDDWAGEVLKGVSVAARGMAIELVAAVGSGSAGAARLGQCPGRTWERRTLATLRGSVDGVILLDAAGGTPGLDLPVVAVTRRGVRAAVSGPAEAGVVLGPAAEVGRSAVALLLGQIDGRRTRTQEGAQERRRAMATSANRAAPVAHGHRAGG